MMTIFIEWNEKLKQKLEEKNFNLKGINGCTQYKAFVNIFIQGFIMLVFKLYIFIHIYLYSPM